MNKKQYRRRRDIKSKLMAAICMLLVSSIMMVSTTYAWFTLSTAPEVTGINTSVGANGNLEMALIPGNNADVLSQTDFTIKSGTADSMAVQSVNLANVTWGNLVDLSSEEYGLDDISLYPAALNSTSVTGTDGEVIESLTGALLQTPVYGVDGRVSSLTPNTVTSTYVLANQNFPNNDFYGVRAVGTAAGMTDRQLTYRNAQAEASTAMAQAKNLASQSLNANGAALANIAMAHFANESATHTQTDVASLQAIVDDLQGTTGKTGVMQFIEKAYINYILAYAASSAAQATDALDTDEEFAAFKSSVSSMTLTEVVALIGEGNIPAAVNTGIAALNTSKTAVSNANSALAALAGKTEVSWTEIRTAMDYLIDTEDLTINGYAVNTVKDNLGNVISSMNSWGGVVLTMPTGGGIYADIADQCGDYSASVKLKNISAGGFTLEEMDAKMQTDTSLSVSYLPAVGNAVTGKAPTSANAGAMPMTDYYGYVIDLAFRTNAANSNLLLQTEGVDRIYKDSTGAVQDNGTTTMGNGSTMTFKAVTADFNNEQVKALMKAIRVVFFDTASAKVLAKGMLDETTAESGADGITMDLVLYEAGATIVTYEPATGDEAQYVVDDATAGTYKLATDGNGTHKKVETEDPNGVTKLSGTDAVITSLNQNTAHAVSVLVYLDGNLVSNKEVSATGSKSVTGTMNLQFSSSAALTPMNYTPLMQQDGAAAAAVAETEAATATTAATEAATN